MRRDEPDSSELVRVTIDSLTDRIWGAQVCCSLWGIYMRFRTPKPKKKKEKE